MTKLPTGRKLLRYAFRDIRRHKGFLVGLLIIVALPVAILSNLYIDPNGTTALSAYVSFAQLIMNAALLYAVVELAAGRNLTIRESYYNGSIGLVRLILLSIVLIIMLLPLLAGLFILAAGVFAPGASLAIGEKLLMVLLAMLVALPSVLLLARSVFSPYIIFESLEGPLHAIKRSWRLTKNRTLITIGRLVVLLLVLGGLLLIPMGLYLGLSTLIQSPLLLVSLQVIVTLIILPTANFYLYRYYLSLRS